MGMLLCIPLMLAGAALIAFAARGKTATFKPVSNA